MKLSLIKLHQEEELSNLHTAGMEYTRMSLPSCSSGEHKVHLHLSKSKPLKLFRRQVEDRLLTAPQELGPPWKSVQAILTTSASIFLRPGNISGWRGLLQANSSYTFRKQREKVKLADEALRIPHVHL